MALIDLWKQNNAELGEKHIKQIIGIAGDGKLLDESVASNELRDLLRLVPSPKLVDYSSQCLEEPFENSGMALQDIVNEVGRRLGFQVDPGRYRGKKGISGHDGLWRLKDGRCVIVEVKTTDAYTMNLDVIANYRKGLEVCGELALDNSSILVVVGRNDTGALEAQIRGSRHAWTMRIISADALLRLLQVKESVDEPATLQRIYDVLSPKEYTRLDGIVDLVFAATSEVSGDDSDLEEDPDEAEDEPSKKAKKFTPSSFHDKCAERIQSHLGLSLVKESRAIYHDPQKDVRILIGVSKTHKRGNYWFSFHPHHQEALSQAKKAFVALGCGSERKIALVPLDVIIAHLDDTWTTEREDKIYWHIRVLNQGNELRWNLRKGVENLSLTQYLIDSDVKTS